MELKFTDSNCRSKTNKQSRKKKNHPTVETQTVKQQQHSVENAPLFVFSLSKWNLKYSDSTIFHRRFVLHWCSHQTWVSTWGFFGPCFQPVFRQWKEESERFWFYLSSMGWLCCFFWRWKVFQYLWNIIAGLAAQGISFCLHPIFTRQLERAKQENNDLHCLGKSLAGLHSAVYSFVIHTQ